MITGALDITKCGRLKRYLRQQVASQPVGDRLPSYVALTARFGVSQIVVRQAYADLEREGLVERRRGSGTYVAPPHTRPAASAGTIAILNLDWHEHYLHNPYTVQSSYWRGFNGAAAGGGLRVELATAAGYEELAGAIRAGTSLGAIVCLPYQSLPDQQRAMRMLDRLADSGLPHVAFNFRPDWPHHPAGRFNAVWADEKQGLGRLVDYLAKLGHRRLAFLGDRTSVLHLDRLEGFVTGMRRNCLDVRHEYLALVSQWQELGAAVEQVLAVSPRPTALVFANDLYASLGMPALQRLGLRVPEDISVVGFDDTPHSTRVTPAITTMRKDRERMAGRAVQIIQLLAIGRLHGPVQECLPVELVERASTTGPPAA